MTLLLDGSIGQELIKRAPGKPTPLWSTQVMMDQPELVTEVHQEYIDAGAKVLSANTYAIHRNRLAWYDLEDNLPRLVDAALTAAESARGTDEDILIAGCMGPLVASYRPDLEAEEALAEERFGELADLMQGRADIFLVETVSSLQEARGALAGVAGYKTPVWMAFSVDDADGTQLRSGEPLEEIAPLLPQMDVVLINCSRPEAISAAIPILAKMNKRFGAYANGFTHISDGFKQTAPTADTLTARTDLGPTAYADIAMTWVDAGASIIGGCCEVGPAHITELAQRLASSKSKNSGGAA